MSVAALRPNSMASPTSGTWGSGGGGGWWRVEGVGQKAAVCNIKINMSDSVLVSQGCDTIS
jgi:hypothetical protein